MSTFSDVETELGLNDVVVFHGSPTELARTGREVWVTETVRFGRTWVTRKRRVIRSWHPDDELTH